MRVKKMTSGVVWIEASEGTFHAVRYDVEGGAKATQEEIREMIMRELPSCRSITFSKKGVKR